MDFHFDLIPFLRDTNTDFKDRGSNVMKQHVALNCRFCSDPSYHMNIKFSGDHLYCVRCGKQVYDVFDIVKVILGDHIRKSDVIQIIQQYPVMIDEMVVEEVRETVDEKLFKGLWDSFIPLDSTDKVQDLYINYMRARGFYYGFCKQRDMRIGTGKYLWRVMIPFRDITGRVVAFTGRSVIKNPVLRYDNSKVNESIMPASNCLCGIYEALQMPGKYLVTVEGPMDDWKLLQNKIRAVGLLKMRISSQQRELLFDSFDSETVVFNCLDANAPPEAREELTQNLNTHFRQVHNIHLQGIKDTGDLKALDAMRLKNQIYTVVGCGKVHKYSL